MMRSDLGRTRHGGIWALGALAVAWGALGCGDLVIEQGAEDGAVLDVAPPDAATDTGKEPQTCEFGDDSTCDDGDSCTTDRCLSTGVCSNTAKENVCKVGGICYEHGEHAPGSRCQVCDTSVAVNAWTPVPCDDGNPCTDDLCDAQVGCFHVPATDERPCDDGLACTTDDRCVDGACVATPCVCGGQDDACIGKVLVPACQRAACVDEVCVAVPDPSKEGKACQSGDLCVVGETCQAGACQGGSPVTCSQDEAEVCQVMACNPQTGQCEADSAPDGEACNPGDPCIEEASCQAGACVGPVKDCSALDGPCAKGVCEGGACEVAMAPEGEACAPDDPCIVQASCTADGRCVGLWDVTECACLSAADCDDGDPCTIDACDDDGACQHDPMPVSPGAIGGAATVCPGSAPEALVSTEDASGGVGAIGYQWQQSADGGAWVDVTGATDEALAPGALDATTWFRRQAVNACGTVATEPVVVTVAEALAAGSIAGEQTLCPGQAAAALSSVEAAGGGLGPVTYAWESRAPGGAWAPIAGATEATFAPGAPAVTTEFRRRASNACGSEVSNAVTVTVLPTLDPGSIGGEQALCAGATAATLTSAASASGGAGSIGYQWQKRAPGGAWQDVAGETGATLSPGTVSETTEYRRLAVDGCATAPSNAVTVTVAAPLAAGSIGGGQSICEGANATALTSTQAASGGLGTVAYQWEARPAGGTWAAIAGATGATYAPGAVAVTTEFRRQASNTCGQVVSNAVKVTVDPGFEAGTIAGDQAVCHGATPATLTSTKAGSGGSGATSYQWQSRKSGDTGWTNVSGATAATYTPGAATVTTEYRRQASNACGSGSSNVVTVSVHSALSAGTPAAGQSVCHGAQPQALTVSTPSGGTGSFSYQWQSSANGTSWTNVSGATSASYQPPALTASTQYRRVATNACGSVQSAAIAITVHGALSAGTVSADQNVCSGAAPSPLTGTTPSGGTGSFSYQWQSSTNGTSWSNVSGATSTSYSPGALTATTYFRRVATNSCGSANSNAVKMTVAAALQAGTIGNAQSICHGGDPSALTNTQSASGGVGNIAYQWQSRAPGGTWSNIAGATSATYDPGVLTATTEFRRQATNACGTVATSAVTVTVHPKLEGGMVGYDQEICLGDGAAPFVNLAAASGGSGTISYQWQRKLGTNPWEDVSGATAPTYKAPGLGTYRRRARDSCGEAYSNEVSITFLGPQFCNPCNPICP